MTFRPEICVKMFIFKVDVQSDHLETKCSWVKASQGKNVTVDVSSGSKCHSGRNVSGRNVKASLQVHFLSFLFLIICLKKTVLRCVKSYINRLDFPSGTMKNSFSCFYR